MKKTLPYIIIAVGIIIIFFPYITEQYEDYKQNQLFSKWGQAETNYGMDNQLEAESDLLGDIQVINHFLENESLTDELEERQKSAEDKQRNAVPAKEPIGVIQINKINLKLPILEGATQENLKYGAVHMTATSSIGEVGNAAIAAHRAKTYGRLFNRLNELEIGDVITIIKGNQEYQYIVSDKLRVEPDDISVLKYNHSDKMITLITCDPIKNPTHRLIVHAKI